MLPSNHIILWGQEREDNDSFCDLCETGCPRDVLAQIKASGFNCENLKKKVFVRETSPIPFHPWKQPFERACHERNFPIVRLFLELGADPDADCCACTSVKTPRIKYGDDQQLQDLFKGGRLWWNVKYPKEKTQALQGELEDSILAGEASEAVWFMAHGVRLYSTIILASEAFGKKPRPFKELVCRMGIPDNCKREFYAWQKQNGSDADVLDIIGSLAKTNGDEGRSLVEKLLLSIDLIGADRLDSFISRAFSLPVQISMLQALFSAYDTSEHQLFVEKAIAMLFKEIVCTCMEV